MTHQRKRRYLHQLLLAHDRTLQLKAAADLCIMHQYLSDCILQ